MKIIPRLLFVIGCLILNILCICIIIIGVFQINYSHKIYPGVNVWGTDISGFTKSEALDLLNNRTSYVKSDAISLKYNNVQWSFTPSELGMTYQIEEVVDEAYAVGRAGPLISDLLSQWESYYMGVHLRPVVVLDVVMIEELVKGIARLVNEDASDASFSVIGSVFTLDPGKKGRVVDVKKSVENIVEPLSEFSKADINLVVNEYQPIQINANEQREIGQNIVDEPLIILVKEPQSIDGEPWIIDRETLVDMLVFDKALGETQETYRVTINRDRMREFLVFASEQLFIRPINAKFNYDDELGVLSVLESAKFGRELDIDASLDHIIDSLEDGHNNAYFQFKTVDPIVGDGITKSDLGIDGLVSESKTFFRGSGDSRMQNISAGSEMISGILIAPGEEFSFNEHLGDVSLDTGFAEAWIIYGGRTIQGLGGGICQVSTTLFRAAFYGGYPILERNPHAYRVGYYEQGANSPGPGLDATIFSPVADFRFLNDRDDWLLIESYLDLDDQSLSYKFYSGSDSREVSVSEPSISDVVDAKDPVYEFNSDLDDGEIRQVDWENKGAKVVVERKVENNGVVIIDEEISTRYQPWGSVYQFGEGAELPEGVVILEKEESE
ncbi:MAG TPA: hypothetical protein DCL76_04350 [Chloroflexi bacterium]|nr:hypothetical protein [Chloroflexota bacterium]